MRQATLFLIVSICHVHYTGLNLLKLTTAAKVDADVMCQVPGMEGPIVSAKIPCLN